MNRVDGHFILVPSNSFTHAIAQHCVRPPVIRFVGPSIRNEFAWLAMFSFYIFLSSILSVCRL